MPSQITFSAAQIDKIKSLLAEKGIYDSTKNEVSNTLNQPTPTIGLFSEIYAYIYSIIKDDPAVDRGTKFWFQAASAINKNDKTEEATNFIRGVTQYGLQYRGQLAGYTQTQIDAGIQRTSNYIGQNVVSDILRLNGLPVFPQMLTKDIGAAILTTLPDMQFGQDAGGWAGAFYYWNQAINYGSIPEVRVGDAILNGLDLPAVDGKPAVHQAPSLNEFIAANAQGTVDAALDTLLFTEVTAGSLYLGGIPAALSVGMKAFKAVSAALLASSNAETPDAIQKQIKTAALEDIISRLQGGNFHIGPTAAPEQAKKASVSYSGDVIQTSYLNGNQTVLDMGLDGSAVHETWTTYGGGSGDLLVGSNAAGAMTASVSWTTSSRATATNSYNFDGSGSGKFTYASGAYATYVSDSQGNVTTAEFTKNGNSISGRRGYFGFLGAALCIRSRHCFQSSRLRCRPPTPH